MADSGRALREFGRAYALKSLYSYTLISQIQRSLLIYAMKSRMVVHSSLHYYSSNLTSTPCLNGNNTARLLLMFHTLLEFVTLGHKLLKFQCQKNPRSDDVLSSKRNFVPTKPFAASVEPSGNCIPYKCVSQLNIPCTYSCLKFKNLSHAA